jgi:hypothetical protein
MPQTTEAYDFQGRTLIDHRSAQLPQVKEMNDG